MRILILGSGYLKNALSSFGHEVVWTAFQPGADLELAHPVTTERLLKKLAGFEPDLFCYFDNGNLPLLIDPENMSCPSLFYSIDTYCNPWHVGYAHGFDLTLVAQKDFEPLFRREDLSTAWFPLFCKKEDPGADFPERDIPVTFVGTTGHKNNPERKPFLEKFRKQHPLFLYRGPYAPIFARSKIVLNQTAFSELNFRCFEAMACGCALLMEKCANGLEEIFTPGENILPLYSRNNADEASATAREWLAKPALLAELAEAGAKHVLANHSDVSRARQLAKLAAALPDREADAAAKRKPYVRSAFGMIASELGHPQMTQHREFYLKLGQQ